MGLVKITAIMGKLSHACISIILGGNSTTNIYWERGRDKKLALLSLPAAGFTFIITAYTIAFCLIQLFNFNFLSYPAGLNPSPIEAVPLYISGGPLEIFRAPTGPFLWEHAITYAITSVAFLWCFAIIGMWPFNKLKLKQPIFGGLVTATCLMLGIITFNIAIHQLKIEPFLFLSYAIGLIFGVLITMTIFQTWPGSKFEPVIGGFINVGFSLVIGAIGYYIVKTFCVWHFGESMLYPDNLFAINTMMLGLLFPMWAAYGDLLEFWPLPPLSKPDDE